MRRYTPIKKTIDRKHFVSGLANLHFTRRETGRQADRYLKTPTFLVHVLISRLSNGNGN